MVVKDSRDISRICSVSRSRVVKAVSTKEGTLRTLSPSKGWLFPFFHPSPTRSP